MLFAFATLAVAISISAVAAYYSIVGLMAIFAASAIPIAIMGTVLEVGKVWTAAWLYEYWDRAPRLLKSYLTIAVIILMFITSMGIFGFLSKAHIEQTTQSRQSESEIVRIEEQLQTQRSLLEELQNSGSSNNVQINAQIEENNRKKAQIVSQYDALVNEQNEIINDARKNLNLLEQYIASNDIRKLQALVGARADGQYGSGTAQKVEEFRRAEEARVNQIVSQARQRVTQLRDRQVSEISNIEAVNTRLISQVGTVSVDSNRIEEVRTRIADLSTQKFELEGDYRKLEAEVGPIKYIAELIYDEEATTDLLEKSVRWVILVIIFVFDPLAILLVIAGSMSIKDARKNVQQKKKVPRKTRKKKEEILSTVISDESFLNDDEVEEILKKKRRRPKGEETARIR